MKKRFHIFLFSLITAMACVNNQAVGMEPKDSSEKIDLSGVLNLPKELLAHIFACAPSQNLALSCQTFGNAARIPQSILSSLNLNLDTLTYENKNLLLQIFYFENFDSLTKEFEKQTIENLIKTYDFLSKNVKPNNTHLTNLLNKAIDLLNETICNKKIKNLDTKTYNDSNIITDAVMQTITLDSPNLLKSILLTIFNNNLLIPDNNTPLPLNNFITQYLTPPLIKRGSIECLNNALQVIIQNSDKQKSPYFSSITPSLTLLQTCSTRHRIVPYSKKYDIITMLINNFKDHMFQPHLINILKGYISLGLENLEKNHTNLYNNDQLNEKETTAFKKLFKLLKNLQKEVNDATKNLDI